MVEEAAHPLPEYSTRIGPPGAAIEAPFWTLHVPDGARLTDQVTMTLVESVPAKGGGVVLSGRHLQFDPLAHHALASAFGFTGRRTDRSAACAYLERLNGYRIRDSLSLHRGGRMHKCPGCMERFERVLQRVRDNETKLAAIAKGDVDVDD